MRHVEIGMSVPGVGPDDAYRTVGDFAQYPHLTDVVRKVTLSPSTDPKWSFSSWEVIFRDGVLHWSERDVFDDVDRTIRFEQTEGDLAEFTGAWSVVAADQGSAVHFDAYFDLGIPSLGPIIDPIAEATLRQTTVAILKGLFGAGAQPIPAGGEPVAAGGDT